MNNPQLFSNYKTMDKSFSHRNYRCRCHFYCEYFEYWMNTFGVIHLRRIARTTKKNENLIEKSACHTWTITKVGFDSNTNITIESINMARAILSENFYQRYSNNVTNFP